MCFSPKRHFKLDKGALEADVKCRFKNVERHLVSLERHLVSVEWHFKSKHPKIGVLHQIFSLLNFAAKKHVQFKRK